MGKLLLDFFPVMLFFIVYKSYDDPTEGIIAATAVAMVATIVQVEATLAVTWAARCAACGARTTA